jgi:acyl-CoA thioesterase-1
MQIPTNYGGPYTRSFAAVYPELAKKYRTGLVEFFLDGVALDINLFQADGIHPTAEAQKILLDNVWPVLEKELSAHKAQGRAPSKPVTAPAAKTRAKTAS